MRNKCSILKVRPNFVHTVMGVVIPRLPEAAELFGIPLHPGDTEGILRGDDQYLPFPLQLKKAELAST